MTMDGRPDLDSMSKDDLKKIIIYQWEIIDKLTQRVKDLEDQISKNSRNSNKPPSSDGLNKPSPKSQRQKSGKKVGGQPGHKGSTLEFSKTPDQVEILAIESCNNCGESFKMQPVIDYDKRQVIDIPQVKPLVTEYRSEIKLCHFCMIKSKAIFPDDVTQQVQYGPNIKSYTVYLNQYQYIPYDRLQELFSDCCGLKISQGSLVNFINKCSQLVEPNIDKIKKSIIESSIVHFDESGMRVDGKTQWVHVASTDKATYYDIHQNRGTLAMDDIGIISNYNGAAIHDHWKPYFKYENCTHSLCNAHHLRELDFVTERYGQQWSEKIKHLLIEINQSVLKVKLSGKISLSHSQLTSYSEKYREILHDGLSEIPDPPDSNGTRGKNKQHKAKNLWDRLLNYQSEVLKFMYDFNVPFTNNLAERDIRMCKLKNKISGCFRSESGKKNFCRIRSFISTTKKQNINVYNAIHNLFTNNPSLLIT